MWGGSAKSRCLPSMENGERTNRPRQRPPRASVAAAPERGVAGGRLEADAVRGAAADDQDVTALGAVRCR